MPDITNNSRLFKRRIFHFEVIHNLQNVDGTQLFDLKAMQAVIDDKMDYIDKYAWAVHDQDTYRPWEEAENPAHKAGALRPVHVHLIVRVCSHYRQKKKTVIK